MDRRSGQRKDVRAFLPHAVFATFLVVMLPALIVFGALPVFAPHPGAPLSMGVGFGLALLLGVAGSVYWQRQVESEAVTFGELMIWSWMRRKHSEDRISTSAHLLGLDDSGRPRPGAWVVREKKLDLLYDLTAALESKDPYTHGHSRRVRRNAVATAVELGLSDGQIHELDKAAVLHDVGKIRLSDRILRKPSGLSDAERSLIQEHVEIGARMVAFVGSSDVVAAVRHHHERWDGSGYPQGLTAWDIPLLARIISVVDAYDAMTTTRPYRPAAGRERATTALREGAGTQFDPQVVEAFIHVLSERPRVGAGILGLPLVARMTLWSKRNGAAGLAAAVAVAGIAVIGISLLPSLNVPVERALAQQAHTQTPRGEPASQGGSATKASLRAEPDSADRAEDPPPSGAGPAQNVAGTATLGQSSSSSTAAPEADDGSRSGDRPGGEPGPGGPDEGPGGPGEGPGGPGEGPGGPGEGPGGPGEGPGGPGEGPKPPKPLKPGKGDPPGKGPRTKNGDPNPDRGRDCPAHSRHC